jgi:hypothetical protein
VDTNLSLTFSNKLYADNRLYSSSNLFSWTANQLGVETAAPVSQTNLQSTAAPAQFFRAAQIQYASSTFAPKTVYGRTITLFFTNGVVGTNVMVFNSSGGGTYVYNTNAPGTILGYAWHQAPFNGNFQPIGYSGLNDTVLDLNYKSATTGHFSGTIYPFGYPYPFNLVGVSGTFTNSP